MSAFLCSDTHFQAIGATMLHHATSNRRDLWSATHTFLTNATGDHRSADGEDPAKQAVTKVIQLLADLNRLALVTRYGDPFDRGQHVPSPTRGRTLSPLAFIKALSCLIYQCSEYLAVDTKLHADLVAYRDAVARQVVASLPEYEQADWELAA